MTPPIVNGLLSKPGMEHVEGHGKGLCSLTPLVFVNWQLIEEGDLLSIGRQAGHTYRHLAETDPTTEAPPEE